MKYNFDEVINRYGTNSLKFDFVSERGMPNDVLPKLDRLYGTV